MFIYLQMSGGASFVNASPFCKLSPYTTMDMQFHICMVYRIFHSNLVVMTLAKGCQNC
jgi:hypothetical protein